MRKQSGMLLAEAVSILAIFLPLIILVLFVTMQASQAYVIARNMNQGALLAARELAEEYRMNPDIVTDTTATQAIFSQIRIEKMVSANEQFSIPQNGWQTQTNPKTVTVIVTYISGVGNPPNPSFPSPDFLGLGSAFRISQPATYRIIE